MATKSAIEWTETTWNPVTGCDRVAAGCDNCYALALSKRLKAMGVAKYQNDGDPRTSGPGFGVTTHPTSLAEPYGWSGSRLVFVNSMSDLPCQGSDWLRSRRFRGHGDVIGGFGVRQKHYNAGSVPRIRTWIIETIHDH